MDKKELSERVKEIIKSSLEDIDQIGEINDDTPLMGTEEEPGIFENSLCVLEVTSALVTEFDVDPAIFNKDTFVTVGTLVDAIYKAIEEKNDK